MSEVPEVPEEKLRLISFGKCFLRKNKLLMRVKPIGFLLNSSLITDVINRGGVFVVDLETGVLSALNGEEELEQGLTNIEINYDV